MSPRIKAGRLACAVLALSMVLSACGRDAGESADRSKSSSGTEIDKFTWGITGEPTSLDIAHGFDGVSAQIQNELLDTVLDIGLDGKLKPGIAESWTRKDPTTYVYTIRKGVKFWDGSPVTPEDVAYSLSRHLDEKVASQAGFFVSNVKEVTAGGDHEVTVTLKKPSVNFEYMPSLVWQVVKKSFAEKHPRDLGSPTVLTMGTGPYKVKSFSPASGAILERNDHYWGGKPAIKTIQFKIIGDVETLRLAVQGGEIDATAYVDVENARRWTAIREAQTHFARANGVYYLSFDVTAKPYDDVHVRRAIGHMVDRASLSAAEGRTVSAYSVIPEPQLNTLLGAEEATRFTATLPKYDFDVAKARAELAKSKYPNGFEAELPYSGDDTTVKKVVQNLSQNLKQIGITLTPKPIPGDKWVAQLYAHKDLGMQILSASYSTPDPGEMLPDVIGAASAKPNHFNLSNYTTPTIEKGLSDLTTATGAQRQQVVKSIVTELADQVPYQPLYYFDTGLALNRTYALAVEYGTWAVTQRTSVLIKRVG
ncbi:ABC transporter substrate-binding protein [Rhizohabitans arisaemae]|uniref:ABC transporter substrate-binding protein n=1 Tax=Rhizohabitans arisaemae TaxID=2720610 RepID=UPI0024B264F4|nr:ABC transporter substrate-binding protein [Rhizohabitans arisaemae]